jgi:hypothetical protein
MTTLFATQPSNLYVPFLSIPFSSLTQIIQVVCAATVDKLNSLLTQISLAGQDTAGVYSINILVDDMGDGTGVDSKTASDSVNVTGTFPRLPSPLPSLTPIQLLKQTSHAKQETTTCSQPLSPQQP